MTLPIKTDYAPMEARVVGELPEGDHWQYEPKWDGFRCLAFRDGASIELRSKSGQSLTRYFPDVVASLRTLTSKRFVLDGEIVVPGEDGLSFDALLQRIHPAQSRVDRLSKETPAVLLAFDLLVDARGSDLTEKPLSERRKRLEAFGKVNLAPLGAAKRVQAAKGVMLSPATTDIEAAREWLAGKSGTDGVMAKRTDVAYATGERTAMVKIKRKRTADCVVGGFRYASKSRTLGSLLLGLYDEDGILHHVGFTSSFNAQQKQEILPMVEKLRGGEGFTGRAPGGPSRWSTERSGEWEALKPKLVVEVEYDHFTNGRFRHGTKFMRWRPEKAPAQCLLDQVAEARAASATTASPRKISRPSRPPTRSGSRSAKHRR